MARGYRPLTAPWRRRWTVRAHLAAIAALVVVVFVVSAVGLGRDSLQSAQARVEETSASLAVVASRAVADNVALAQQQVSSIATNPGLASVFDDPARCNLAFSLELFPSSHLDVYGPTGDVVCSSAGERAAGVTYGQAEWFADASRGPLLVPSAVFADDVTGEPAVAMAIPVAGPDGAPLGGVAVILPTADVAQQLTEAYGGPSGYQFAIVDTAEADAVVAESAILRGDRHPDSVGDQMDDALYLATTKPVEGTTWQSFAGIDRGRGLAPTRSLLLREIAVGAVTLAVLLLALGAVYRRIARPLRLLTSAVGSRGPHVREILDGITGPSEIEDLSADFRSAIDAQDIYEGQLAHQALHDPLTGLPNRALLAERLGLSLERSTRGDTRVALLFLDIDRFKLVNDSLGHGAGDQLLQIAASRLARVLEPGDTLARFGGDEFVVVIDDCHTADQAMAVANRLLAAVQAPAQVDDSIVRMSASIGIVLSTRDSDHGGLLRDADNAMYLAKERGGGRAEMFDAEMRDRVTARRTLEHELRVALERHQLRLVYQPKLDLLTGDIAGVEALLRWEHPALGMVPPSTFIPIAEETGLIVQVGRFVLDEACRQLAVWNAEGIDVTMAVNISERQLADPQFPGHVAAALAQSGASPDQLCLELTESLLMADTIRAKETLDAFHAIGVQLSVDDFGTGYSSLAYLHRFPVDELKIDRAFVKDLIQHPEQHALITAMVAMGKALGLRIVAEGVETTEQATQLRLLGCDQGQGYLFARPDTPERLHNTLNHRVRART